MSSRLFLALLLPGLLPGCCWDSERQLDERHPEPVRARLKLHVTRPQEPETYRESVVSGDIILFRSSEDPDGSSFMWGAAFGDYSHAAIVVSTRRDDRPDPVVLTARNEFGVRMETLSRCANGRSFYVFSFPRDLINPVRLRRFAERAASRGTLDYDYSSAILGLNSELTPDRLDEISGEYTCATVVAGALHYGGLSLDRAHCSWQHVTPSDLVLGEARRNLNYDKK